jgi:hypothetical protein
VERENDGTQYRAWWNSQVAGDVTRRCMAGKDTLGSASELGFNKVEDRAGDSETGVTLWIGGCNGQSYRRQH